MGPHEPYWRTNTSFSPPLSRGWEHRFQIEGLPYGSQNGVHLDGSSLSSDSKESGVSVTDDHFPNHSMSDGVASYFSSPSDSFQTQHWMPQPGKGVGVDDFGPGTTGESASGPMTFFPCMEGTSAAPFSTGSTSSRSDGSEYEGMLKRHAVSSRNFSSRYSFMSKPIHPISVTNQTREPNFSGNLITGNYLNRPTHNEAGATTPQRETLRLSSASSSNDFTDVSEQLDCESVCPSHNLLGGFKCGLCNKFLSQRSPWSSRRIVRSGDMPVTGVLSCHHVFHADCLEQTIPKMQKQDPPCPLCAKENAPDPSMFSKLKNDSPKLRQVGEDGPSRPWNCGQVGDCVEGALHASPRSSSMLLLNRNRLKKHLSFKGSSSKELSDKLKNSASLSMPVFDEKSVELDDVEISSLTIGPTLKR